jgi:hypothetical protein
MQRSEIRIRRALVGIRGSSLTWNLERTEERELRLQFQAADYTQKSRPQASTSLVICFDRLLQNRKTTCVKQVVFRFYKKL